MTRELPDSLTVQYEIFPWDLKHWYYHRVIPEPEKTHKVKSTMPKFAGAKSREPGSGSSFTHSGSIFRSVSLGTDRAAGLDSGMELQLSGRLGKGVLVTAALSDQNLPLQPEGDTRTLEEIDKVYVSVQSERLGVNLGDYDLSVSGREFASVDRKLTGAQAFVQSEQYQAMLSAATSKGEYRSMSFNGVEGLQGPYQLRGDDGRAGILVLAGTEKVWLDGQPLTRGDNHDYIIDYSRGEITFGENVPLSSDSRIVVDFQYASESYNRSLYHSAGEIGLAEGKLKISYAAAREADNRNDPLSISLSPEVKSALREAGDNPLGAMVEGAEYVGPGEGEYIRRIDPLDSTVYYQWAGEDSALADSADYNVIFSYIGAGNGGYRREYSELGKVYYVWIGKGAGDYLPVILAPLPQSQEVADIGLTYAPRKGLKAGFEAAGSRYDRNTFSGLDDGNNLGAAYKGSLTLDSLKLPFDLGGESKFGLSLKVRSIMEDFRRLDRTEEAEYNRRWGYQDTLSPQEESYEVQGYIIPAEGLRIGGGGGTIDKGDYNSTRREASFDYTKPEALMMRFYGEDIRMKTADYSGYWRRGRFNLWRRYGIFKPGMDFIGEDNSISGEGFRFGEYRPFIGLNSGGKSVRAEYTYREDEARLDGRLHPRSRLNRGRITYRALSRNSDFTLDYTRSYRQYAAVESTDVQSDLGRVELNAATDDGAVQLSFQHRISQTLTPRTAQIPYEVGWGEGEYVKVGGQFYPDPAGNYILISRETGEFSRSSKVKSSLNFILDFRHVQSGGKIPPWLGLFTTESYFSVEEESSLDDPWRLYALYLPNFRGDSTRFGAQTIRQDVFYRKGDRNLSLRFRAADDRSLNRILVGAAEKLNRTEYSLRVRKSAGIKNSVQSTLTRAILRRWSGIGLLHYILSYSIDNRFYRRLSRSLEFNIGLIYETSEESVQRISARMLTVNPHFDYSIFQRGRISLDGSWTGVSTEAESIPYEMTAGRGAGSNYEWGAAAGYRIGNNLNLSANYRGESKVGRPVIHSGRMELRAFF